MKVPHEYEADERITKCQMSARTCRAVWSVGSSVQQSNQEEVANGRGPARAEEDRGTGQGASGVFKSFFSCSFQEGLGVAGSVVKSFFFFLLFSGSGAAGSGEEVLTTPNDTAECVGIHSLTWIGRVESRSSREVLDNRRSATDLTRGRVGGGTGRIVACSRSPRWRIRLSSISWYRSVS